MDRSKRGFGIFAPRIETRGREYLYVCESSIAFEGPHVRVYVKGHRPQLISDGFGGQVETPICAHMNVTQAKQLRDALDEFIGRAEADELTEPPVNDSRKS